MIAKVKVLVIDDERSFTRLLQVNLEAMGEFEVRVENWPEDACATAREYQPDVILLVPERGTDKLFEVNLAGATDLTPLENAAGRLISDPTKTIEMLNTAGLAALGIIPVSKTVVLDSLTAIDPLLEKCEGVCVVGNHIVLTHDNDFNVGELGSTPANPDPNGPFVQVELLGANYPKIYIVPLP